MNTDWSSHVQGPYTLYLSRKLRFDDSLAANYRPVFNLAEDRPLTILDIGCGPGALTGALARWYPRATVLGLDRDSAFVEFARTHEAAAHFQEGDATALPFQDNSLDVTISNTVSEHVETHAFFSEQHRVLHPGGVCLVLSVRPGLSYRAACLAPDAAEQAFWQRVQAVDDSTERFSVARYALSVSDLPGAMAEHGFHQVRSTFLTIPIIPDSADCPPERAAAFFEASRQNDLEALGNVLHSFPDLFPAEEIEAMRQRILRKHETRLQQYQRGEKQWDTSVTLLQIIRGVK